jgi:competence ComEA-like helix-hairpin-helix protein
MRARWILRRPPREPRRGSALIAVLWCLVLLSVAVVASLHATRLELRMAKNHSDLEQARWLAVAGIERAKALIHEDLAALKRAGTPAGLSVFDSPSVFREVPFGKGAFRVIRQAGANGDGRGLAYGVSDEESRLDVNHASQEELMRLPGMTADVAAAILDWRDDDRRVTPGGAEEDEYLGMAPPRVPRNGPIASVPEMLLIRGVTPDLLLGEDGNGNGLLDPEEDDGAESPPADDADGVLDAGWSALLSTHAAVEDVNARGEPRVSLRTATEETLAAVPGLSTDIAKAIVQHRERSQFGSIFDLLDVTAARAQPQEPGRAPAARGDGGGTPEAAPAGEAAPAVQYTAEGGASTAGGEQPAPAQPAGESGTPQPAQAAPEGGGSKVIDETLLKKIGDEVTAAEGDLAGVVNVNTASAAVLACLPGIDEELAAAIVARRESNGYFLSIADLLDVPGLRSDSLKRIAGRIATRSGTFRITAEGFLPATGARKRVHAVVRPSGYRIETVAYREEP